MHQVLHPQFFTWTHGLGRTFLLVVCEKNCVSSEFSGHECGEMQMLLQFLGLYFQITAQITSLTYTVVAAMMTLCLL